MEKHCEHMVREGICGASITVCCVYQNHNKYMLDEEKQKELHGLNEIWCDYPNIVADDTYANAIRTIAKHMYGGCDEKVL